MFEKMAKNGQFPTFIFKKVWTAVCGCAWQACTRSTNIFRKKTNVIFRKSKLVKEKCISSRKRTLTSKEWAVTEFFNMSRSYSNSTEFKLSPRTKECDDVCNKGEKRWRELKLDSWRIRFTLQINSGINRRPWACGPWLVKSKKVTKYVIEECQIQWKAKWLQCLDNLVRKRSKWIKIQRRKGSYVYIIRLIKKSLFWRN